MKKIDPTIEFVGGLGSGATITACLVFAEFATAEKFTDLLVSFLKEHMYAEDKCSPATTSNPTSATTTEHATEAPTATMGAMNVDSSTDASASVGEGYLALIGTPSKGSNETQ